MRLAFLLACLPLTAHANPNGGLSRPFLGSPGALSAWDVTPDMVPDGAWDWGAVPGYGFAAARADDLSPGLAGAVATITCAEGRAGPEMNVMVNYWLQDPDARQPSTLATVTGALSGDLSAILPGPALDPGGMYTLDLFNSAISGRPAAYDLGQGKVPTSHISFPFNAAPPQAYHDAVATFVEALRAVPPEGRILLRFIPQRGAEDVKLTLPIQGLTESLDAVAERSLSCP